MTAAERVNRHIAEGRDIVDRLLLSRSVPMSTVTPSSLPTQPGLYAFSMIESPDTGFIRAGRAAGAFGLQQRVYNNHLMGSQAGNLASQLVRAGEASTLVEAKAWIRANLAVRWLVADREDVLPWAEHFMLAVLRPRFSD